MPTVHFTPNLRRHVNCPTCAAAGTTVRQALDAVFDDHPALRGYVLDDQDHVRTHIAIFVNGEQIQDRQGLSDPVQSTDSIHVMQALSGG